ncbi:HamA C-terminal domain-containing protein [Heyndrickxia sp. NPDC080065]|uniref:HamA C-terminal domain-containing protein n=1 Tax=Heyndrickxia sp. NPDC080065 TaxID=3390568 RepID=UPI003D056074
MDLSIRHFDFLDSFDYLWTEDADDYGKNKMNLFMLKINANQFDYNLLQQNLLEPLLDFSVSRKAKEEYKNKHMSLSKQARERFVDHIRNTGELGELLLYCFLETHLNAPKILSKLELKTSTAHYVNGSDGVHFLKLGNGNFQLIFGESKTVEDLTSALTQAFQSIYNFKNEINDKGNNKSGIRYERSLISNNLGKETFSEEEKSFIKNIIYPKRENDFEVDDAFGILVGFEVEITDEDMKLPNALFRDKIKNIIDLEVRKRLPHIRKKINEYELWGHNFYIYVLPFSELDKSRKSILKEITT